MRGAYNVKKKNSTKLLTLDDVKKDDAWKLLTAKAELPIEVQIGHAGSPAKPPARSSRSSNGSIEAALAAVQEEEDSDGG